MTRMTRKRPDIPMASRPSDPAGLVLPDREGSGLVPSAPGVDLPDREVMLADVEAELASKQADLAAARQLLAEAQVAVRGLERDVEALSGQAESMRPKVNEAELYQEYLRRQVEIRRNRAERRTAAARLPAVARSPLDVALAARVSMRRKAGRRAN